jgi:hypothetical protein
LRSTPAPGLLSPLRWRIRVAATVERDTHTIAGLALTRLCGAPGEQLGGRRIRNARWRPDDDEMSAVNRPCCVKPLTFHFFPPFLSFFFRIFGKIRIFQILTKLCFAMVMMMIAFVIVNSGLEPLIEGLCVQILF